jgi:hypothetical protein
MSVNAFSVGAGRDLHSRLTGDSGFPELPEKMLESSLLDGTDDFFRFPWNGA